MGKIAYRKSGPCGDCPWRRDVEPGQFEASRFDSLRSTSEQPDVVDITDVLEQPLFACHLTDEGREQACAGWLAVASGENLRIRLALVTGGLPVDAIKAGAEWPPLFSSYAEMVARQARANDGLGEIKNGRPVRRRKD